MATRLLAKLRVPVTVEGHELVVSASMGVSLLPDNAREISELVNQSNMAMQHAKHLGGNNFQFYTDSLQGSTPERLQLENHLRKAIEERQLSVFYQPKLCLATGRLNAAEALVRWGASTMGHGAALPTLSAWPKKRALSCRWANSCCARLAGKPVNGSARGWLRFGCR